MRMNFQDPATEVMEGIIELHHTVMFYLIVILTLVSWMLITITTDYGVNNYIGNTSIEKMLETRRSVLKTINVQHGRLIEVIWTVVPSLILIMIALPSFSLLYDMEAIVDPVLTIKAVGHQWYWSYEYSDYVDGDLTFDSYMIPEEDLVQGQLRLLDVDRKVWVPLNTHIRVVITAADVLHSWAVPSLGIKLDAIPGRLNQTMMFVKREGVFFGQCSELCGVNHGFMPIAIKAVPMSLYNFWVDFNLNK